MSFRQSPETLKCFYNNFHQYGYFGERVQSGVSQTTIHEFVSIQMVLFNWLTISWMLTHQLCRLSQSVEITVDVKGYAFSTE